MRPADRTRQWKGNDGTNARTLERVLFFADVGPECFLVGFALWLSACNAVVAQIHGTSDYVTR